MRTDAIVNAANESLAEGGGVCGAIFAAAGEKELGEACASIGHCECGRAVATPAFRLKAKYIIHTVGPVWEGGGKGEEEKLSSCYTNSLLLAREMKLKSIAFPLISAGIFGYPKEEAVRVAITAIRAFLRKSRMEVYLLIHQDPELLAFAKGLIKK